MARLIAFIAVATGSAVLAALVSLVPLAGTVELKTYDARVRATTADAPARDDIVLVDIDEASLRQLDPLVGRWPWPRLLHGQAIDFLSKAGARAILYDILFTERDRRSFPVGTETWTGAESDRALADAVRRAGNVVVMADAVPEPTEGAPPAPPLPSDIPGLPSYTLAASPESRPIVVLPFDELSRAARGIGHNFFVLDSDGPVRRVVPFLRHGDRSLPSGSLATALVASGTTPASVALTRDTLTAGVRRMPVAEQRIPSFDTAVRIGYRALVRYGGPFRHVSFYAMWYAAQQQLAGEKPDLDPAIFKDRIVLIGTTAPGLSDVFAVPLEGKMAGTEVHANFIDSLLTGHTMAPASRAADVAVLLSTAIVVAAAFVFAGPLPGVVVTIVAAGGLWLLALAWFRSGVWLPVVMPATAMVLAAFGGTGYQYLIEGREKRMVKQLFSRFVSKDVFHRLLEDPSRAALGGERREMSVLFSDIRDFTTISEHASPEAVVTTLNDYFTRMVAVLFEHRGTVDKFVGDMVMALFGAPVDDPDHADHAVAAALGMAAELDRINRERASRGEPPLEIGIGVNSGEMVAGMIGSDRILSYTVIGDAVNLGSRIESLNKQFGTRIIVSDETRRRLKRRYDVRPLGNVTVKGRSQPVSIFEVRATP